MKALWQRLVAGLRSLLQREPAAVVKAVTWAVTWAVTYASQQWFHWADDRQALITGLVVAWVLGQIADWIATRQSVYSPATVERILAEPYTARHSRTAYSSDAKDEAAYYDGTGPGGGGGITPAA